MKKFVSVILLACMFNCSAICTNKPAHAESSGLWGFLWDMAVDAAISYAIDYAIEAASNALSDNSSGNSDSSYYSRRIVADSINVRENPDKNSAALTQLHYDQVLHIHKTVGKNMKWSLVETPDKTQGWVSSDYIAPLSGKGIPIKTTTRMNLRMTPEAKSSWNVITQIDKGTEVLMIRRWTVKDKMWFYVQTPSGTTGWLSSKFVE